MRSFARLIFAVVISSSVACTDTKPPPVTPEAPPATTVEQATLAEEQIDLSPVAAPAEVFGVGRLRNPKASLDRAGQWASLPFGVKDMLAQEVPGIESVLMFDAPVDVILAVDRETIMGFNPHMVVSFGLTSLDRAIGFAAKKRAEPTKLSPGVYRMGEKCIIAAAVGAAPARLVCGPSRQAVDFLLDYATRGLPNEQLGDADLHLEVRAEPLRHFYGTMLERGRNIFVPIVLNDLLIGHPEFDRTARDAVHALASELLLVAADLDRAVVDVRLRPDTQDIAAKLTLAFRSSKSWTAQGALDRGRRAGPPPALYWDLPGDAFTASFSTGANHARFAEIRDTLSKLADSALDHFQAPPRVRTRLVRLLETLPSSDAPVVHAMGSVPELDPPMQTGWRHRRAATFRSAIGWHLVGIEDDARSYKKWLDDAATAATDREVKRYLDNVGISARDWPQVKRQRLAGLGAAWSYEIVMPESMFGSRTRPGEKPQPRLDASMHVAVLPDGKRTWIGFSSSKKVLTTQLAKVLKKAPASVKLSPNGPLRPLGQVRAVAGGYVSLGSSMQLMESASGARMRRRASKARQLMPNGGRTPMLYLVTAGTGPSVAYEMFLPKRTLEDVGAMFKAFMTLGSDGSTSPMPAPPVQ